MCSVKQYFIWYNVFTCIYIYINIILCIPFDPPEKWWIDRPGRSENISPEIERRRNLKLW